MTPLPGCGNHDRYFANPQLELVLDQPADLLVQLQQGKEAGVASGCDGGFWQLAGMGTTGGWKYDVESSRLVARDEVAGGGRSQGGGREYFAVAVAMLKCSEGKHSNCGDCQGVGSESQTVTVVSVDC
eukprot:2070896-Rhodomonas_salina.1